MNFLSVLIKPVSGRCNIDCKYCFYKELTDGNAGKHCMSEHIMEELVDKAINSGAKEILFAFQGGEPLLAGEEYYERFLSYVKGKNTHARILYSIQTNGTLLTDRYIDLFKQNDFLVGVSLDGPKYVQDKYRLSCQGQGTFETVLPNAQRLLKAGVRVNILTVVTPYAASRAKKIYQFYKKHGFDYIQFIPCMDSVSEIQGETEDSLTVKEYYTFLTDLFDVWYTDFLSGEYISIRHFDNWVRLLMGQPVDTCSLSGKCGSYFVIEREGEVYPCDFYVGEEYYLGNIVESDFAELLDKLETSGFLKESLLYRSDQCRTCANQDLCHGGCKRDWVWDKNQGKSRYCIALNRFFTENRGRMIQIAQIIKKYHKILENVF